MQDRDHGQPTPDIPFTPSKIAEGKTKIVWETENPDVVRIESKDDITAGDGARHDILEGKAELATTTTANVFKLLEAHGISTHFIAQDSPATFLAKKVDMIQLECVARRIATGSYLKRHPEVEEGQRFEVPVVEFYIKNDSFHDPIISYESKTKRIMVFDAKAPVVERSPIDDTRLENFGVTLEELDKMEQLTRQMFVVIEKEWEKQKVLLEDGEEVPIVLADMKGEFGRDNTNELILADVIDNDSWRIWPDGDKSKDISKQSYRNLKPGDDLNEVKKNYELVAAMTERFITV